MIRETEIPQVDRTNVNLSFHCVLLKTSSLSNPYRIVKFNKTHVKRLDTFAPVRVSPSLLSKIK